MVTKTNRANHFPQNFMKPLQLVLKWIFFPSFFKLMGSLNGATYKRKTFVNFKSIQIPQISKKICRLHTLEVTLNKANIKIMKIVVGRTLMRKWL